jgi:signal transduction histidine kinase/ActR/RegA family two-component response regulator
MKLIDFFSSQIITDEEGRKTLISLQKVILIVVIVLIPALIIMRLIGELKIYPTDIVLSVLLLSFSFYYFLLKKGKLILVNLLFIITGWIAMTILAGHSAGIRDVSIIGYLLLIFLATLLRGYGLAIIITVLSIFAVWVMAICEYYNILIPQKDPPLIYARDFTVFIILVLTAILLFERSFRYSYQRINKELQERIKTEEQLSVNESKLIKNNSELNESYNKIVKMNEELVRAKEKALESDRLKTAFLNNISHEIRTPMNGIVGFLNLLQQSDVDIDKRAEYIGIINSCTHELATLVNDFIDISRIESGTIELNITAFYFEQILKDVESTYLKSAKEKGLSLSIINEINNVEIRSDRGKISQVLNNLVSNAIKFTPVGSVSVKASRLFDNLLVSVTDTGIGIMESDKEVIFERFRQAETGLNRPFGGSGLGLAISKGNIDFLGGTITVDSESGKGSVFTFSVPVVFMQKEVKAPVKETKSGNNFRLNILVVEDDKFNFLYLKEILKDLNPELFHAKNGIEAVDIFTKNKDIDIILMDLKMPEMDGYQASRIIRSLNPDIPIIAVTAFAMEEDRKLASPIDFNDYIVKPFNKDTLFSIIESYVSGSRQGSKIV